MAKKKMKSAELVTPPPTQEAIARRAYEIYVQRQGLQGNAQQDWFRAERELAQPRA